MIGPTDSLMEHQALSIREINDPAWRRFIAQTPDATIFHHPAWIGLLAECYAYRPFLIGLYDSQGEYQAGLPCLEINNPFTRRLWSCLPFSDHCTPLSINPGARKRLYEDLVGLKNQPGVPDMEIRWDFSPTPVDSQDYPYVLTRIELDPDPDKMFGRIHHAHRRNVKIARKHRVRVESVTSREAIAKYYDLHVQTRQRQGVPAQPRRFFELLAETVIRPGRGFILLAYQDETCLAGAVFLHWGRTLTYKYGASRLDSLVMRPNHLIFWHAIQWGSEHGFQVMDLGRTASSNTGLRDFKKRWGASETPLAYSHIPDQKQADHSARYRNWMKLIIQHSPTWVCRLAGDLFYKYAA